MVGEDGVAAVLPGLAEHLVAKLERDQHAADRLVRAPHQQADVVPILGERRGREPFDRGEELGDEHRATLEPDRAEPPQTAAAIAAFSARCAGTCA